jgi:hypothetical protein
MDITLDGGETTIIKALGFSGTHMDGETLLEKMGPFDDMEFLDTLKGLIDVGYVMSDKRALHSIDDVKNATFFVNTGYSRDLRDALDPRRKQREKPSRRVRRE